MQLPIPQEGKDVALVPPAAAAEVRRPEADEAAVTVCTLATRFSLEVEAQLAVVLAQQAEVEAQLAVVEVQLAVVEAQLAVVLAQLAEVEAQLALAQGLVLHQQPKEVSKRLKKAQEWFVCNRLLLLTWGWPGMATVQNLCEWHVLTPSGWI